MLKVFINSEPYFSEEELRTVATEAAGATSAVYMQRHGGEVFDSEAVLKAIEPIIKDAIERATKEVENYASI